MSAYLRGVQARAWAESGPGRGWLEELDSALLAKDLPRVERAQAWLRRPDANRPPGEAAADPTTAALQHIEDAPRNNTPQSGPNPETLSTTSQLRGAYARRSAR